MIVVTGAAGQLGRLVIAELLRELPPSEIIAAVRDPAKAQDLAARGVEVRLADYDSPKVPSAFKGGARVVIISRARRSRQASAAPRHHRRRERTGAKLIAYTSILHADCFATRPGREHRRRKHFCLPGRAGRVATQQLVHGELRDERSGRGAARHSARCAATADLRGVVRDYRPRRQRSSLRRTTKLDACTSSPATRLCR